MGEAGSRVLAAGCAHEGRGLEATAFLPAHIGHAESPDRRSRVQATRFLCHLRYLRPELSYAVPISAFLKFAGPRAQQPAASPRLISSVARAGGLNGLHIFARSIMEPIRKTVIDVPKSSVRSVNEWKAPLLLHPQPQPDWKLTGLWCRLQSWHTNCDSVDLAKG